ncbi:MAG TPA: glycosyltransferase family 39 protein [Pyrinomonadaceae bacterium]|nr:glycosyltransferase family 39 protein [Pyrinomonadaceae bacterium]
MAATAQPVEKDSKVSRLLLAALILIIVAGALLRVYELGDESVWLDEAFSIKLSLNGPARIIEETSKDVHPPLYYFALHYWMIVFGDSERGARLLSALFGVLAIFATYKVASGLFGRATALVASALVALSRFHLEFSQEARMYTLLGLLALASMYFFVKIVEGRTRAAFLCYVAASALMMYTQVYSVFVLAAQNLFVLTLLFASRETFRRVVWRWLLAQVILVVLFLPWLSVLAQQVSHVQKGFWIPRLPARFMFTTLVMYAGSYVLSGILFTLAALAVFFGWRRKGAGAESTHEGPLDERLKITLLLLWLSCSIVLPFLVSQFASPIFLPKYTIAALPAFLILAARGLSRLRFHQLRAIIVLLILFFSYGVLKNYYAALKKDPWREAVASFGQLAKPGDLVLFNQASGQYPFDYYSKTEGLDEKPFPDFQSEMTAENLPALLRESVKDRGRVWLVVSHPGELTPLVPRQLAEWYGAAKEIIYPGVEMYLFEKRR